MRARAAFVGALLGALTSLPLLGLYALGVRVGLPSVPFDIFDWLARVTPGAVIAFFIDTMITIIHNFSLGPTADVAKAAEMAVAQLLLVGAGIVLGLVVAWRLSLGPGSGWAWGRSGGIILALAALAVEALRGSLLSLPLGQLLLAVLWVAAPPIVWGTLLGGAVQGVLARAGAAAPSAGEAVSRRNLLLKVAVGSAGTALALWGLSNWPQPQQEPTVAQQPQPANLPTPPPAPAGRIEPAPGTRPEVTANDKFYRVDINLIPPRVDGNSWRLVATGLFTKPRQFSLADLAAYPAVTMPVTLSCISNLIGGDLISNGYWTGLRLRDLLADLGLQPTARELHLRSADNFYESVVMSDMMDERTLLVYGMNGQTLPVEHGYPLRIIIPDRYGMKQPKWIVSIEAAGQASLGYWPERGWSEEAMPQIMSQIDPVDVAATQNGKVPIGGIAWSGAQGISKVEVQIDSGAWQEATLRTPPLGPLTWVQWRYDWPATGPGQHAARVRATDGRGNKQIERSTDAYPDGATGYDSLTFVT